MALRGRRARYGSTERVDRWVRGECAVLWSWPARHREPAAITPATCGPIGGSRRHFSKNPRDDASISRLDRQSDVTSLHRNILWRTHAGDRRAASGGVTPAGVLRREVGDGPAREPWPEQGRAALPMSRERPRHYRRALAASTTEDALRAQGAALRQR